MIKRLLRIYHWRARARFWRQRAQRLEAQLADTVMLLEAERERNQIREDTFVSASIMGQRGMYGVPPRVGAAVAPKQVNKPIVPPDPYPRWDANLTGADRMEFQLWQEDAERNGIDIRKAQQDFLLEIAKRRVPLNDDPFSH